MLVHIIAFSTTLTHDLVIGIVMKINEIDQCTTIQSSGQIQQKSIKGRRRKIRNPMVMDKMNGRINRLPTRDRVHSSGT
jgi:hypothetical protein